MTLAIYLLCLAAYGALLRGLDVVAAICMVAVAILSAFQLQTLRKP